MIDNDRLNKYVLDTKTKILLPSRKKDYLELFLNILADHYLDYYTKTDEQQGWELQENQELHDIKTVTKGIFNKLGGIELVLTDSAIFIPLTEHSPMDLIKRFYTIQNQPGYSLDYNGLLVKVPTKKKIFNNDKTTQYHFISIK